MRAPVVGVMGGVQCSARIADLAERLGQALARQGWTTLSGGRPVGVMEAVSKGAAQAGGMVVALLPGEDPHEASRWATVAVASGIGYARNSMNVLSSDAVVALPGSTGTVSEIAYAITYGKPLALLGWDAQPLTAVHPPFFQQVEEVVEWLKGVLPRAEAQSAFTRIHRDAAAGQDS